MRSYFRYACKYAYVKYSHAGCTLPKRIEVFAGAGVLTTWLTLAGYKTCSLDVTYRLPWMNARESKQERENLARGNALDLLSPSRVCVPVLQHLRGPKLANVYHDQLGRKRHKGNQKQSNA